MADGQADLREIIAISDKTPQAVSPATLRKVQNLLDVWDKGALKEDLQNATQLASEIKRRVAEAQRRLCIETKYREAVAKLERMDVLRFRLHYGDYLASYLRDLQGETRLLRPKVNPEDKMPSISDEVDEEALIFFRSAKWTAVHERLAREESAESTRQPLMHLIHTLAKLKGTSGPAIITIISLYVARNAVAHSQVTETITRKSEDAISMIVNDLRGLADAPKACKALIPAIREAIFKTVDRYCETFEWCEIQQLCLSYTWREGTEGSGRRLSMDPTKGRHRVSRTSDERHTVG